MAVVLTGARPLYISIDAGATWAERGPTRTWDSVAISDDGRIIYALGEGALMVTRDYGATWEQRSMPMACGAIEASSDGAVLAAMCGAFILVSADTGIQWTRVAVLEGTAIITKLALARDGTAVVANMQNGAGSRRLQIVRRNSTGWQSELLPLQPQLSDGMACSAGASTILATSFPSGDVALSADTGQSWSTVRSSDWPYVRQSAGVSSDGKTLLYVRHRYYERASVFVSTDGGESWSERSGPQGNSWGYQTEPHARLSSDGQAIAMAPGRSQLPVVSTDGGQTWTQPGPFSTPYWENIVVAVALSNGELLSTPCVHLHGVVSGRVLADSIHLDRSDCCLLLCSRTCPAPPARRPAATAQPTLAPALAAASAPAAG